MFDPKTTWVYPFESEPKRLDMYGRQAMLTWSAGDGWQLWVGSSDMREPQLICGEKHPLGMQMDMGGVTLVSVRPTI